MLGLGVTFQSACRGLVQECNAPTKSETSQDAWWSQVIMKPSVAKGQGAGRLLPVFVYVVSRSLGIYADCCTSGPLHP